MMNRRTQAVNYTPNRRRRGDVSSITGTITPSSSFVPTMIPTQDFSFTPPANPASANPAPDVGGGEFGGGGASGSFN